MNYSIFVPARILDRHSKIQNLFSLKPLLETYSVERVKSVTDPDSQGFVLRGHTVIIAEDQIDSFAKTILKLKHSLTMELTEFMTLDDNEFVEAFVIKDEKNKEKMIVEFNSEDECLIFKLKS